MFTIGKYIRTSIHIYVYLCILMLMRVYVLINHIDSNLTTVIDDSSSLPLSISPRRKRSMKIIVIGSPRFCYASDGKRESFVESRRLRG